MKIKLLISALCSTLVIGSGYSTTIPYVSGFIDYYFFSNTNSKQNTQSPRVSSSTDSDTKSRSDYSVNQVNNINVERAQKPLNETKQENKLFTGKTHNNKSVELEKKIEKLQEEINSQEKSYNEMKTKQKELSVQHETLNCEITNLKHVNEDIQTKHTIEIQKLQDELKNVNNKNNENNQIIKDLRNNIELKNQENFKLSYEVTNLKEVNSKLKEDVELLNNENNKLNKENNELKSKIQNLKEQIKKLKKNQLGEFDMLKSTEFMQEII